MEQRYSLDVEESVLSHCFARRSTVELDRFPEDEEQFPEFLLIYLKSQEAAH